MNTQDLKATTARRRQQAYVRGQYKRQRKHQRRQQLVQQTELHIKRGVLIRQK